MPGHLGARAGENVTLHLRPETSVIDHGEEDISTVVGSPILLAVSFVGPLAAGNSTIHLAVASQKETDISDRLARMGKYRSEVALGVGPGYRTMNGTGRLPWILCL